MLRVIQKMKRIGFKVFQKPIFYFKFHIQNRRKLNVGSGGINPSGEWLATDITLLDITSLENWKKLFGDNKLSNIMAEHVWEHLSEKHTTLANKNCFDFLQNGGTLRLAVPDGFHPDKEYIEYVRVGGTGPGAEDHKILYTYKTMKEKLESAGFEVNVLEYWDEFGKFHYKDWSTDNGLIRRSRRYDKRNTNGQLKYTSLIVDAIKI